MPFRKFVCILSILLSCQFCGIAQPVFQWAKVIGDSFVSSSYQNELPLMTVDATGNQYIADMFSTVTDADPGPGTHILYPDTSGRTADYYLLKLNMSGDFVWARHIKFEVAAIDLDKNSNLLLIGKFRGDLVDVDPGPDSAILTRYRYNNPFLCKLDRNGLFKWSYYPKGADISAATFDPQNRVVVTGYFYDTVDFDPGPAVANMVGRYSTGFTVKLDEDGDYLWSNQNEGLLFGSVATDEWGSIFQTAWIPDSGDVDPGPIRSMRYAGQPSQNILINKLDSSGNYIWSKMIRGSSYYMYFGDMTVDKAGNAIVAGLYTDTLYSDDRASRNKILVSAAASYDLQSFVVKIMSDGRIAWADDLSTAGSYLTLAETYYVPLKVAIDTANNIIVASSFRDSADFDPGPAIYRLKVHGNPHYYSNMDMSLICLYPDGSLAWARNFGADTGRTYATGVGIGEGGRIYVSGCFGDSVDFDPGVNIYALKSHDYYHGYYASTGTFMLKLGQCSNPKSYTSAQTCDSFLYNGYMRRQSGTYYQRFSNGDCDSIAVLDLIIDTANANVMQVAQTLYAQSPTGVYQWINCDSGMSAIQGANDWKFTNTVSGRYALMVTDNRCVAVSPCFFLIGTGVKNDKASAALRYYPNPTREAVTIDFGSVRQNIRVDVYDHVGRHVQSAVATRERAISFSIAGPDGLYFLSVTDERGSKSVLKLTKMAQ